MSKILEMKNGKPQLAKSVFEADTSPMKEPPLLICSKCKEMFKSFHIERQKAYAEVLMNFTKHYQTVHPEDIQNIMQAVSMVSALSATVIIMSKYSTILDSPDKEINNPMAEGFGKLVDQLEEVLGIEVCDTKPNQQPLLDELDDADEDEQGEDGEEIEEDEETEMDPTEVVELGTQAAD